MESQKSKSTYDKSSNLVNYTEFNNDGSLKCLYNVVGNTLFKKYLNNYYEDGKHYKEMVSSIIKFEDNIMLFQDPNREETSFRAILSGQTFTSFCPPKILSNIVTYEDLDTKEISIETFTVKSNLIDEWKMIN